MKNMEETPGHEEWRRRRCLYGSNHAAEDLPAAPLCEGDHEKSCLQNHLKVFFTDESSVMLRTCDSRETLSSSPSRTDPVDGQQ